MVIGGREYMEKYELHKLISEDELLEIRDQAEIFCYFKQKLHQSSKG